MRRCGVDAEDLQDMIAEIKRLDPKPGPELRRRRAADAGPRPVRPRCWARAAGGSSSTAAPCREVLVDTDYHAELTRQTLDRRAKEYLTERFQSANWLAKALDQRARTMLRVAKAIFARQLPFLDGGVQHLRPLVLRDIAERDRAAREHGQPGHRRQIRGDAARNLPAQVLLHHRDRRLLRRAVAQRGGDPPADQAA